MRPDDGRLMGLSDSALLRELEPVVAGAVRQIGRIPGEGHDDVRACAMRAVLRAREEWRQDGPPLRRFLSWRVKLALRTFRQAALADKHRMLGADVDRLERKLPHADGVTNTVADIVPGGVDPHAVMEGRDFARRLLVHANRLPGKQRAAVLARLAGEQMPREDSARQMAAWKGLRRVRAALVAEGLMPAEVSA